MVITSTKNQGKLAVPVELPKYGEAKTFCTDYMPVNYDCGGFTSWTISDYDWATWKDKRAGKSIPQRVGAKASGNPNKKSPNTSGTMELNSNADEKYKSNMEVPQATLATLSTEDERAISNNFKRIHEKNSSRNDASQPGSSSESQNGDARLRSPSLSAPGVEQKKTNPTQLSDNTQCTVIGEHITYVDADNPQHKKT
jgi:hypothetical protein